MSACAVLVNCFTAELQAMRKIYPSAAWNLSIFCLIFQNAFVLAETSQHTLVISESVVTAEMMSAASPTFPEAEGKGNVIQVMKTTSTTSPLMAQAETTVFSQKLSTPAITFKDRVTSVTQLSDIQPQDWAFNALQSLIERYRINAGYPDGTYQGNRAMTRYEFAADLSATLHKVNKLIATDSTDQVSREDLLTLQRLQEDFAAELTTLLGRVGSLEAYTAELEANQFSTTTKLVGGLTFAVTAGSFSGDRIIDATGAEITNENPNLTIAYRANLDFISSFSGTDQLFLRLEVGSDRFEDNTAGFLEPYFGSGLEFSLRSAVDNQFLLTRANYSFKPFKDFKVIFGPQLITVDYFDKNSYANNGSKDFATLLFNNNYIVFPNYGTGAGVVLDWNPKSGPITVRAAYVAEGAANSDPNSRSVVGILSPLGELLYPDRAGKGGLFGAPSQTTVELEYAPSQNFAVRFLYSGGTLSDRRFDAFGVNAELTLWQQLGIFGRYGYSSYDYTAYGDIEPQYWMAGVAFRDLFVEGALTGIAAGQPFIEGAVGNATQTNFEAFYRFPISDNILITPLVQVIANPGNQDSNGTIVTGNLRTYFSF